MSGMNPWLADIYGTDGADDIEKTAQSHLLQKLAQENNLDLNQFNEEELQALLQEVMGQQVMQQAGAAPQGLQPGHPGYDMNPTQAGFGQPYNAPGQNGQPSGQVHTPQGPRPQAQGVHPSVSQAFAPASQPSAQGMSPGAMQQGGGGDMASLQKEAQAKFEEADLLGRVMAHAYTQELEKIAQSKTAGKMDALKGAAGKARDFAKSNKKAIGAAAATGAAGFAAGRMSKKASIGGPAFQKLAEMHAADILGAAGFDPNTGNDLYAQQAQGQEQQIQGQQGQEVGQQDPSQGSSEEQFAAALDESALQMLANAGYDVNEILARIQYAQQQGQQGQA